MAAEIPNDLISLPEAAKLVRVVRQTVLRWLISGRLRGFRAGHRWRISRADLLALVQQFGPEEARQKRIEDAKHQPISRRELRKRDEATEAELRRIGIR